MIVISDEEIALGKTQPEREWYCPLGLSPRVYKSRKEKKGRGRGGGRREGGRK